MNTYKVTVRFGEHGVIRECPVVAKEVDFGGEYDEVLLFRVDGIVVFGVPVANLIYFEQADA